jgi:OFA family oxalate/formate antiporter-like MFS transporter
MENKPRGYGVKGMILIIACIFIMFQGAAVPYDCLNVIVPKFSGIYGWSEVSMYMIASIVSWVSAFLCILFSVITNIMANSARRISIVALIVMAVAMLLWGHCQTLPQFVACFLIASVGSIAACYYGAQVLIGNWFPKKKGMVMGIITIGNNLSTLLIAWILTLSWNNIGIPAGFNVWTIITIVPLILIITAIKEYPEQCGAYPDNDPSISQEDVEALLEEANKLTKTSPFTLKKMLQTKQTWLIFIGCGLLMTASTIVAQLVPAFMSRGYSETMAIVMLTVTAGIAIPTSLILGAIDQKAGSKKACIVVAIIGAIGMFFMAIPATWCIWVSVIGIAFMLGTTNNILCSITLTVFGRYDYKNAYGVIYPLYMILYSCGMWLISKLADVSGSYALPCIIMGIVCLIGLVLFIILKDNMIGRTEEDIKDLSLKDSDAAANF